MKFNISYLILIIFLALCSCERPKEVYRLDKWKIEFFDSDVNDFESYYSNNEIIDSLKKIYLNYHELHKKIETHQLLESDVYVEIDSVSRIVQLKNDSIVRLDPLSSLDEIEYTFVKDFKEYGFFYFEYNGLKEIITFC